VERSSGRLAHFPDHFGGAADPNAPADDPRPSELPRSEQPARRPALALTAEGPRRADLIAWASAHRTALSGMRLLAPAGIRALLQEHVGLEAEVLKSGTIGPAATAGLAAAGDIDAMIAFSDPIELRPGDNTTRSLTRLAVFWDIPIAGNRATADLLLATVTAVNPLPADLATDDAPPDAEPVRGAVKLWTVRATVDDVPGRLAILAASLARRAINILAVQVHLTPDGPVDELLVAASPVLSSADLTAAVVDGGARAPRVASADAHALVDAPTRALALATRLIRSPDDLAPVLLSLLPGAQLTWRAEPPDGHEDTSTQLWLKDPTGGGFLLTRTGVPFTPAESARAYAMMDVATVAMVARLASAPAAPSADAAVEPAAAPGGRSAADAPPSPKSWQLVLPDARELLLRTPAPADAHGVLELHTRLALTSRLRRYLAGADGPARDTLAQLLAGELGHCLVAEDADGRIIGLASLLGPADRAELAVVVDTEWREHRVASVLVQRLAAHARQAGVTAVRTIAHTGNAPIIRIMTGLGQRLHREYDGGVLTLIATLAPATKSSDYPAASV
jgi:methylglyoxal synthase/GNAT superfamily N-acetyltransferase